MSHLVSNISTTNTEKDISTTHELPDKDLELFWYSYKQNILNLLGDSRFVIKKDIKDAFTSLLVKLSTQFNKLHDECQYIKIQDLITQYVPIFGWLFIGHQDSMYLNIYVCHLKRYINVCNELSKYTMQYVDRSVFPNLMWAYMNIITNCQKHSHKEYYNDVLSKLQIKDYIQIINDYDHFIIQQTHIITELVDFVFEHKLETLLQYIHPVIDLHKYVLHKYNHKLHPTVSPNKIIYLLNRERII